MGVRPRLASCGVMVALCAAMWTDVTCAADPVQKVTDAAVPSQYAAHIAAMLREGFAGARESFSAAEKHYQAAKRLVPDDPQREYAFGLVLLKNLKHADAVAQFREAATAEHPYLPAARATIRETIRKKDYLEALQALTDLAEIVQRHVEHEPDGSEAPATARWMGLALGYLTGPHVTDTVRQQAADADTLIQERLPQNCREQYGLGKQDVLIIEGQLQIEQQSAEAAAKLKQQAEEEQSAARRAAYQARQEELLDTKEKWDGWFTDTTRELDSQLDQLGDQFDTLNRSVTSLIESIQAAQLEIKRLQTIAELRARRRNGTDNSAGFPAPGTIEAQLLVRSQELNVYVNELSAAMTQRDHTARQAEGVLAQRALAEQKYRDATGTVAKQASRVQQWDTRLKNAMEQAKQAPPSSRKLRSLVSRAQSFATYDPFDLNQERQRLLGLYGEPGN